ncbi:hypothetical protein [Nannocystis bainbridge]|uniref:Uncharacterized protein n=1 Tax=Nannocystis bainbridge TaxID=2995303 RepID=A0ABT5E7C5_9BACT|nr:hypothetical protein [Nannocystis bainbridge]MDC0721762.1 hypothetical protein [Nannocystis bainbridge]
MAGSPGRPERYYRRACSSFASPATSWSWNAADLALTVSGAPGTAAYLVGFAVSELLLAAVIVVMLRGMPRVHGAADRAASLEPASA